jgi:hypothetical protein
MRQFHVCISLNRTSRITTFVETSLISFAYLHACSIFNIQLVVIMTDFWQIKSVVPPAHERKKLAPLALMFFSILFNYTILRDTKDVLMVTAPKSGAEVIPFIKTYVNLPAAIVSLV